MAAFNFQTFAVLLLGIEATLVPVFVKKPGSQALAAVFLMVEEEVLAAFAPTAVAPAPASAPVA